MVKNVSDSESRRNHFEGEVSENDFSLSVNTKLKKVQSLTPNHRKSEKVKTERLEIDEEDVGDNDSEKCVIF